MTARAVAKASSRQLHDKIPSCLRPLREQSRTDCVRRLAINCSSCPCRRAFSRKIRSWIKNLRDEKVCNFFFLFSWKILFSLMKIEKNLLYSIPWISQQAFHTHQQPAMVALSALLLNFLIPVDYCVLRQNDSGGCYKYYHWQYNAYMISLIILIIRQYEGSTAHGWTDTSR